ncbi:hypothetical protein J8K85_03125 [Bacteroides fragilis]|nr:hypothetical protein [Bacteroides fragilis]
MGINLVRYVFDSGGSDRNSLCRSVIHRHVGIGTAEFGEKLDRLGTTRCLGVRLGTVYQDTGLGGNIRKADAGSFQRSTVCRCQRIAGIGYNVKVAVFIIEVCRAGFHLDQAILFLVPGISRSPAAILLILDIGHSRACPRELEHAYIRQLDTVLSGIGGSRTGDIHRQGIGKDQAQRKPESHRRFYGKTCFRSVCPATGQGKSGDQRKAGRKQEVMT